MICDDIGSNTACIIDVITIVQKMVVQWKTFSDITKSVFMMRIRACASLQVRNVTS